MPHLDEGIIHSWLDGALSPEEAAHVDAHVKDCPQCAASVAEARGFIAASSRILTALDNAPRGVIPASAARKRVDPMVWRIAATVLVVAAGSLMVVRNEKGGSLRDAVSADTASLSEAVTTAAAASASSARVAAPGAAPVPLTAPTGGGSAGAAPRAQPFSGRRVADVPATKRSPSVAAENQRADARDMPASSDMTTAQSQNLSAKVATPLPAPPMAQGSIAGARVSGVVTMDQAADAPLKVVGTPKRLGARVTVYEVAPGDTVTLTESTALALQSVVISGAGTTRMAEPQGAEKAAAAAPRRTEGRPTNAPESQPVTTALSAAAPGSPAPSAQIGMFGAMNSISWVDRTTGATLTLSGRMSEARLQQIKVRIERERAAAAARKNP